MAIGGGGRGGWCKSGQKGGGARVGGDIITMTAHNFPMSEGSICVDNQAFLVFGGPFLDICIGFKKRT